MWGAQDEPLLGSAESDDSIKVHLELGMMA